MPRKVNYGLDYDIDDDTYDDYDDYDYDSGVENGKSSQVNKTVSKPGIWQCSICTYDNAERLLSCDICGVLRDSSNLRNDGEKQVEGTYKDSGASIMAESLFAPVPCGTPKTPDVCDEFLCKEASNSYEKGKHQALFDDLQKTFVAPHRNHSINIAPFRFDSPSPDDMVSAGKYSSKITSKVDSVQPAPTRASSSITGKKGIVKFSSENEIPDSSSATSSKTSHFNEGESSRARDNGDGPQILASNLHHLNLDKNSGCSNKSTNSRRSDSHAQYKPEKWMLLDQEQGISSQLNLAVVGHVDSGKSTLSGRLLHHLGRISKKEMHKYEKEAKEKGKGSFAYAYAMDESTEERERGVTMTVAVAYFDSKKHHVVLLDSPGHKDFVPNMISGATQADAAILVVDASVGSFEAGMDGNGIGFGQTKEHAQLIRSFGVEQIIVAVNKMDVVEYSRERFDFIKLQLGFFLRSCGFKESSVTWIPVSAMADQNLVTTSSDVRLSCWYQGLCLLDAIDSLQPPVRDVSKPLLLPICDVIKSQSLGQVAASGKLEAGAIRNGSKVLVMPSGDLATVRSIERDSRTCSIARAGDSVAFSLHGIEVGHIIPGGVLCHPDFPVAIATCLELKVLVLDIAAPILIGSHVEFHIHHAKEAARVVKILSLLDQKTGKVSKKTPRFLTAKQSALIEVALDGAVCVEEFSKCRALGRAFLRASGNTIAVGIVTRVIEREPRSSSGSTGNGLLDHSVQPTT